MSDDYPSEEEIERIKAWPHDDFPGLMVFVASIWWSPEFGVRQRGRIYRLATGGWSGNEEIIEALADNTMFWTLCWQSSRRGGLHIFNLPNIR